MSSSTGQEMRGTEVNAIVVRELGKVFRVILRLRIVGVLILGTLTGLYAAFDPVWWKVTLPAAGCAALIFLSAWDLRWKVRESFPPVRVLRILLTVIGAQLMLVALTGGIRSPFLLIVPVMALPIALGTGRARYYLIGIAVPLTLVWFLAACEIAGVADPLVPPFFHATPDGRMSLAWSGTAAFAVTVIMAGAGAIALFGRQALERAVLRAAEARAETAATMRERNRELVALSGALAHELKNPLSSIRGLAALLSRKAEPGSKEAAHLGVLLDEVARMGAILDEFLNFSRPAGGLAVRETDPKSLVDDVALLHGEMAANSGVLLSAEVSAPIPLRCDERKVKQVLVNLVQNAIDATPSGGAVVLSAREGAEGGVVFEVRDDGPGLAPEIAERLFTVGATTKATGSGLGLVIARGIAEQHGGTLGLEDGPEGGCVAVFALPARPADEVPPGESP